MNTKQQRRPERWLAGWYTLPGGKCDYVNKRLQAAPWPQAADWLRAEIGHLAGRIDPAPVATIHVASGADIQELSFDNCWDFIEWAMHERIDRGIWGRDQHRCYYLIADDHEPPRVPVDLTPPLHQGSLAPTGTR